MSTGFQLLACPWVSNDPVGVRSTGSREQEGQPVGSDSLSRRLCGQRSPALVDEHGPADVALNDAARSRPGQRAERSINSYLDLTGDLHSGWAAPIQRYLRNRSTTISHSYRLLSQDQPEGHAAAGPATSNKREANC